MASDGKPVTAAGNLKPPSRLQITQWVKIAWNRLPSEMIWKSFATCAISNKVDGSEDQLIQCMKRDGCLFQKRYMFVADKCNSFSILDTTTWIYHFIFI